MTFYNHEQVFINKKPAYTRRFPKQDSLHGIHGIPEQTAQPVSAQP